MATRDRTFPTREQHWSELRHMGKSPAHYRAAYLHPREPTAAMRFGSLVHFVLLGGDTFVVYDGERRGNAWKDFKALHATAEIVTASELAEAEVVAAAVRADPVAAPLLLGRREQELKWTGPLGRACGGRVDVIAPGAVVEVKTTADADPARFSRMALRMGWHAQLAWYQDGAGAVGFEVPQALIIAVETDTPYAVTVLELTPRALEEGRKLNRLWMERVALCEAAGHWPAYAQSAVTLDVAEDVGLIIDGEMVAA